MSKNLQHKEVKLTTTNEVEGKVEAVFSVFNEIDSDNDVVLPNSIKSGYGDRGVAMVWAHDWKDVIGRGEIVSDENKATFKGQFIMDTERGRDAFNTVKAMGDLQQWSFGYEVLDSENGTFTKDGTDIDVRYLKDVQVWEVSPVLVGANQNTETVSVKEQNIEDENTGTRFNEDVDELLTKLSAVLKRAKALTALRLSKEKTLSEGSTAVLSELQDSIQEVYQDIDTLLDVAGADDEEKAEIDDTTLLLETEQVLLETFDPEL
jgi:HK97 family phage prohead protease|tara:strand:+ start:5687 stop:6475 length:789 start_codon:yes stop_codon:yes gene_type:complete